MASGPLVGASASADRFNASLSWVLAVARFATFLARLVLNLFVHGFAFHGLTLSMLRFFLATLLAKVWLLASFLVPTGLDMESRKTLLTHLPSALSTVTAWLLARCVACASWANLCLTNASALLTSAVVSSVGAAMAAPILANASTRRLSRQSTIVSREVPCAVTQPTAAMVKWAGIHCHKPRSTISYVTIKGSHY